MYNTTFYFYIKSKKQDIQFLVKIENNYYCLDGVTFTEIYLERVIFLGNDIVYSENYDSIAIWKFFQILFGKLFLFWKKEQRRNKS